MGGTTSVPEPDSRLASLKKIGNNNKGDVVVIPVDESTYSEAAFEWYVHHSHRPENVVRVVHCQELQLNTPYLPELKATVIEEQLQKSHQTGKRIIEKYEDKLSKYQVPALVQIMFWCRPGAKTLSEAMMVNGSVHSQFSPSAGELVMECINKFNGTQVVMGTRGFGMLRRAILGSVSQYVINQSHVPVTVVPPEVKGRFKF